MMNVVLLSLASVIGVSLLSLVGILFFLIDERFIGKVLLYFVSFSTGALLGDVFIHIIPEMADEPDFFQQGLLIVLLGILVSFMIEKIIHWRHCHVLPEHHHGHSHGHHHHPVGIMSIFGESVHNFIDGIVIAASFLVNIPLGISTALAIVFHEIPHEIGNFAVLLHSGFPRKKALLMNFLAASAAILGTVLVLVLSQSISDLTVYMLPFAAGNLLYIAGSDLIPELHKETKLTQGIIQLLAMITGMLFMYCILFFE
jgi:zinc and cadmium transporter